MKKPRGWTVAVLLLLALAFVPPYSVPATAPSGSRLPQVRHLKGQFLGFGEVDYVNACFCVGDSFEIFGVTDAQAAMFVAVHPGATLDIEVKLIEADTLEAGRVEGYYGLEAASLNGYRSDKWWTDVSRILGYKRAWALFDALEDSLTSSPDDMRPMPRCPLTRTRPPAPK